MTVEFTPIEDLRIGDKVKLVGSSWSDREKGGVYEIVDIEYDSRMRPWACRIPEGMESVPESEKKSEIYLNNTNWSALLITSKVKAEDKKYFHSEDVNLPDDPRWITEIEKVKAQAFENGLSWARRNLTAWPYKKNLAADLDQKNKKLNFYWVWED